MYSTHMANIRTPAVNSAFEATRKVRVRHSVSSISSALRQGGAGDPKPSISGLSHHDSIAKTPDKKDFFEPIVDRETTKDPLSDHISAGNKNPGSLGRKWNSGWLK